MEDEEVNIPIWGRYLIIAILSFLVGMASIIGYKEYEEKNTEYRSPEELVTYLEEMAFNHSHLEDLPHHHIRNLVTDDETTLGELKWAYKWYMPLTQNLLTGVVNDFCYKKQWKKNT